MKVEVRIGDLGPERARFLVQLRIILRLRVQETGFQGKLGIQEGNNPDFS